MSTVVIQKIPSDTYSRFSNDTIWRCAFGSLADNTITTPPPSHSVWLLRAPGGRPTNRRPAEKAIELPPPRDRLPRPAEQAKGGGEDTTSSHGGLGAKAMSAPCVRSTSNCGHWPTWLARLMGEARC